MKHHHTPGPWLIAAGRYLISAGTQDRPSRSIAAIMPATDYWQEEQAANGHLLEAAPDMLAALKVCDDAFGKFGPDDDSRYGIAWAAVEAAIAKAERGLDE